MLTIDFAIRDDVVAIVERHGADRTSLIPILQDVKKAHSEITDDAMQVVADLLGIHPVEVYSVATFYAFLHGAARRPLRRAAVRHAVVRLRRQDRGRRSAARPPWASTSAQTTDDGVFTLEWASCVGMCDQGPALLVNDKVFTRVTPEKVAEIVAEYRDKAADEARQDIVTARNELTYASIAPDAGLKAALALSRGDIVEPSPRAALKGRGGAGFPTGMKWNFCAAEKSEHKYIICNADEGEPGTFKDRVILRDFADLVFEGMTIGGPRHRRRHGHRLPAGRIRLPARPHLNDVIHAAPRGRPAGQERRRQSRASTSTSSWRAAPAPTSAARRRR